MARSNRRFQLLSKFPWAFNRLLRPFIPLVTRRNYQRRYLERNGQAGGSLAEGKRIKVYRHAPRPALPRRFPSLHSKQITPYPDLPSGTRIVPPKASCFTSQDAIRFEVGRGAKLVPN